MTPDSVRLRARRRIVALATSSLFLLATTASAIAQPSPSPSPDDPAADLTVDYPAGNARAFVDGEQNVWSLHMSQSFSPKAPTRPIRWSRPWTWSSPSRWLCWGTGRSS
ncbi:MAG: hypothetical protein KY393_08000 [Actinobacteria bacterium]|nr:hypothetical protein [Actinomycetota bacterium]